MQRLLHLTSLVRLSNFIDLQVIAAWVRQVDLSFSIGRHKAIIHGHLSIYLIFQANFNATDLITKVSFLSLDFDWLNEKWKFINGLI